MRSFGVQKFLTFIVTGTFTGLAGFILRLTDSVVVGHVIGEDALAGVNMVTPLLTVVSFVAGMIALGTANNYAICMGRLDKGSARGFFVQGFLCACVVGVLVSLLAYFADRWYLPLLNGSEYVTMYAEQYLRRYWPVGLLECVLSVLVVLAYVDGDRGLCLLAYGVVFVVNAAVAYPSVQTGMGAAGASMGTVVAIMAGIVVLCAHFFRKTNSFRFVWRLSLHDIAYVARASFGSSASMLLDAVLIFFLAKLVIVRFGSDFLPVAGVAFVLWQGLAVFSGVALAVQPIVTVYWGERNAPAIRQVMRVAVTVVLGEAVALGLVLAAFPGLMVNLMGVELDDLTEAVRLGVRLMCIGFVPIAFSRLFRAYFLFIERPYLSLYLTLACYGPIVAFCLTMSSVWGLAGVWAGLAAGPTLGVFLMAVAILWRRGRAGFPLMLPRGRDAQLRTFTLHLTEREIVKTSRCVAQLVPEKVANRAALLVEEVFMTVREKNAGRLLSGEVTLDLNDGVVLVMRDDGVIFDITDSDQEVSSLRTFLVASVMERHRDRINLVTSGFNRNVFRLS